jgi:5-methylcytosine-specific restriction endonuclease McrA
MMARALRKVHIARSVKGHLIRDTYANGVKNSWWDIRNKVLARDDYKCFYCGQPAEEVHHLIPLSKGGTTTMANLISICKTCHDRQHYHLRNRH